MFKGLRRSFRKRQTLRKIRNRQQHNRAVINVHCSNTVNTGDIYCAPHQYFDQLKGTEQDILTYKSEDYEELDHFIQNISDNTLIIGGGGLLNRNAFAKQLRTFEFLTGGTKKMVLWGVGHNNQHEKYFNHITDYNIDVEAFQIAGTRDYSMPGEFVPCVSCLHPIFDRQFDITQETGVVFHKDILGNSEIISKFKDYPTAANNMELEELIPFIGGSEKIITNSYHVMYWSMLLGRKVAVVPNSSKFYDFKYSPVITTFDEALNDIKKADIYDGVLEECREINHNFAEKVFDYLNA